MSGNPQPIKNLEEPPTKMTLIANPLRQEQSAMTKEPQKVTSMKEQPSKKNALFTDTETDNDISNINTENKKLKNLFADTEDEDDVLQRGRQLTNLYKKENQLEEPKKVSKLFMDEENNTPLNMLNKLEAEKKNESNQSQLDISQEETKDMGSSQRVSTTRPSVTKVSGRISVRIRSQAHCFNILLGTSQQAEYQHGCSESPSSQRKTLPATFNQRRGFDDPTDYARTECRQ